VILYSAVGAHFCLKTYELALKDKGICLIPRIERYDPTTDKWNILGLKEQIGPISGVGYLRIFLLRYEGVDRLHEFPHISRLADQLPQKGKARAM